jgi:hypothetical protein
MSIKPVATWGHFAFESTVGGYGPDAVHQNSFLWALSTESGGEARVCA